MNWKSSAWCALFLVAVILSCGPLVAARQPLQSGPSGQISGYVIGATGYPFDWALVNATDGTHSYVAFSGMSGFYLMRVPPGTYQVSVHVSGYWAETAEANVTDGSTTDLDFHLKQAPLQVPEFPSGLASALTLVTLAALILICKPNSKSKDYFGDSVRA